MVTAKIQIRMEPPEAVNRRPPVDPLADPELLYLALVVELLAAAAVAPKGQPIEWIGG